MLSEENARKIAKFVRLLGSDNDHEAVAAARMLQRALAASGMNFSDLGNVLEQLPKIMELVKNGAAFAQKPQPKPAPEPEKKTGDIETIGDAIIFAYDMRDKLMSREKEFIESIHEQYNRGKNLSQKQVDWLKIIAQKLMRRHGYKPEFTDV